MVVPGQAHGHAHHERDAVVRVHALGQGQCAAGHDHIDRRARRVAPPFQGVEPSEQRAGEKAFQPIPFLHKRVEERVQMGLLAGGQVDGPQHVDPVADLGRVRVHERVGQGQQRLGRAFGIRLGPGRGHHEHRHVGAGRDGPGKALEVRADDLGDGRSGTGPRTCGSVPGRLDDIVDELVVVAQDDVHLEQARAHHGGRAAIPARLVLDVDVPGPPPAGP